MLLFKYWVEFDDEGEIKKCHKEKPKDIKNCKEYLVKLIPIDRSKEILYRSDKFEKDVYKFVNGMEKFGRQLKDLSKIIKLK